MEPPKIWRERRERYLGIGIICEDCQKKNFPKTRICPDCGSENVKPYKIAERGTLKYFTQIMNTGDELIFNTPYIVGLVELEDGIKVTAQIVDCDFKELRKGIKLEKTFRVLARNGKEGLIKYGFKFRPI
ncbi:MAG: Zn-ribbon domain-containing OB-fold protein [Candidatus Heimdallarchaeaceae archaeon]